MIEFWRVERLLVNPSILQSKGSRQFWAGPAKALRGTRVVHQIVIKQALGAKTPRPDPSLGPNPHFPLQPRLWGFFFQANRAILKQGLGCASLLQLCRHRYSFPDWGEEPGSIGDA